MHQKRKMIYVEYNLSQVFFVIFTYKMTTRQLNIKNRSYYFYNDLINVLNFEASKLELDKKHGKTLIFILLVTLKKKQNGMLAV